MMPTLSDLSVTSTGILTVTVRRGELASVRAGTGNVQYQARKGTGGMFRCISS
jgi:hypothetical protein